MTQVIFTFVNMDGTPQVDAPYKVVMSKPGFMDNRRGVVLPEAIFATTDAQGKFTLALQPSPNAYHITSVDPIAEEDGCCPQVSYRFYVPESKDPLQADDLYVAPAPSTKPWDEQAMQKITQAVVDTGNFADAAEGSATSAATSAADAAESLAGMQDNAQRAEAAEQGALAARDVTVVAKDQTLAARDTTLTYREQARLDSIAATQAATDARASKDSATASAGTATTKAQEASASAAAGLASQQAAKTSETNSKTSENAAKGSADSALASKNAAGVSETNAGQSAASALTSKNAAAASEAKAKTSETNAKTSETNAATAGANAGSTAGTNAANAVVANKQDKHDNLTALSSLGGAAKRLPIFTGTGAMALQAIQDSKSDNAPDKLMLTGAGGILGNALALAADGLFNLNNAPLGSIVSAGRYDSDAAAYNWPVLAGGSSVSVWWNVLTEGTADRTTQTATQAYDLGGNKGRTFVRTKQDSTWTGWREQIFRGDFGIANNSGVLISGTGANLNNYFTQGHYYVGDPANVANCPTTDYGTLEVKPYASNICVQEYISINSNFTWRRVCQSGTWTAWRRVVAHNNILAGVGLANGFPTGGILEFGTNANGNYLRYCDGSMVCWKNSTNTYTLSFSVGDPIWVSATIGFNFASTFADIPSISPYAITPGAAICWAGAEGSASQSGFSMRAVGLAQNVNTYVGYIARGRWQ